MGTHSEHLGRPRAVWEPPGNVHGSVLETTWQHSDTTLGRPWDFAASKQDHLLASRQKTLKKTWFFQGFLKTCFKMHGIYMVFGGHLPKTLKKPMVFKGFASARRPPQELQQQKTVSGTPPKLRTRASILKKTSVSSRRQRSDVVEGQQQ